MQPQQYHQALDRLRDQYGLARTTQFPVDVGAIHRVESALGCRLPGEYVRFLTSVGSGDEVLGRATWYSYDFGGPANILTVNEFIAERARTFRSRRRMDYPEHLLLFYGNRSEEYYGFLPVSSSRRYEQTVWRWHQRQGLLTRIAPTFSGFLRWQLGQYLQALSEQEAPPERERA